MYGVIVNYPCFADPDWERLVKRWLDDELREVAKRAMLEFGLKTGAYKMTETPIGGLPEPRIRAPMQSAIVRSIRVELFRFDGGGYVATGKTVDITDHPLVGKRVVVRGGKIVSEEC